MRYNSTLVRGPLIALTLALTGASAAVTPPGALSKPRFNERPKALNAAHSALSHSTREPRDFLSDISDTNNDFQSMPLCRESCFAAAYQFNTVPYFTLDE